MSRNSILPVIFGMNPPTKEVIILPCRNKNWSGFDVLVYHADFKDGTKIGDTIDTGNFEELKGLACHWHIRDSTTLRKIGEMFINAAEKFDIREATNDRRKI